MEQKLLEIKENLYCDICFDVVKLSSKFYVEKKCKEHKNKLIFDKVYCYDCLNNYMKKSVNNFYLRHPQGCSCEINRETTKIRQSSELWNILDIINNGELVCNYCDKNCFTQSTYLRHIKDKLTSNDKISESCQNILIKCKKCNYIGKRSDVNGLHYTMNHDNIMCVLCDINVLRIHYDKHMLQHQNMVNKLLQNF